MGLSYKGYFECVQKISASLPRGAGEHFNAILSWNRAIGTTLVENPVTCNYEPESSFELVEIRCRLYATKVPAVTHHINLPGSDQRRTYFEGHLVQPLEYIMPIERQKSGIDATINGITGKFYPVFWHETAEHLEAKTSKSVGMPIAGYFEILQV